MQKTTLKAPALNLRDVISCLNEWEVKRNDPNPRALIELFGNNNYFELNCSKGIDYSQGVHVYPGINKEGLNFFVIPVGFDTEKMFDIRYIVPCTIGFRSAIPDSAGADTDMERIKGWEKQHDIWIQAMLRTKNMYQAFYVPGCDLAPGICSFYFALRQDDSRDLTADLIVDNGVKPVSDGKITLSDTVRPVPPFKPYTDRKKFYLLDLVTPVAKAVSQTSKNGVL